MQAALGERASDRSACQYGDAATILGVMSRGDSRNHGNAGGRACRRELDGPFPSAPLMSYLPVAAAALLALWLLESLIFLVVYRRSRDS